MRKNDSKKLILAKAGSPPKTKRKRSGGRFKPSKSKSKKYNNSNNNGKRGCGKCSRSAARKNKD